MTEPGIAKMAKAPKGKRIERFDSGADGLALRITDRGTKTWNVCYHFPNAQGELKHHRLTLGQWPAVGLAPAREEARRIKAEVRSRIDPKASRAAAQVAAKVEAQAQSRKSFRALAESYIALECPSLRRGSEVEAIIRRELLPPWDDRHTGDFRRSDLTELTDRLIMTGTPMAAYRVYQTATRIFNWALNRGDIEASPFAAMRSPVQKEPRDRALKDNEIKAIWPVLTELGYPFGAIQRLLLLLGQRRSEVAEMKWPEVDFDKREWTIPASRSKSKREHIVPLPDATIEILENLPRFAGGSYIFTTTNGEKPVSGFSKVKILTDQMLHDRANPIADWRVHDLRRTCRTGMARLGVPEIVSERILNHLPQGLGKVYNVHEYLNEKRNALMRWEQEVKNITEPAPDNVVKIKEHG
jgi:integrase